MERYDRYNVRHSAFQCVQFQCNSILLCSIRIKQMVLRQYKIEIL